MGNFTVHAIIHEWYFFRIFEIWICGWLPQIWQIFPLGHSLALKVIWETQFKIGGGPQLCIWPILANWSKCGDQKQCNILTFDFSSESISQYLDSNICHSFFLELIADVHKKVEYVTLRFFTQTLSRISLGTLLLAQLYILTRWDSETKKRSSSERSFSGAFKRFLRYIKYKHSHLELQKRLPCKVVLNVSLLKIYRKYLQKNHPSRNIKGIYWSVKQLLYLYLYLQSPRKSWLAFANSATSAGPRL